MHTPNLNFEDLLIESDITGGGGLLRPHPLTLQDLTNMGNKIQQTDGTAPKTLPYPGEFALEELTDIYTSVSKLHHRLNVMRNNAAVSDNPSAKKRVDKIIISVDSIKKICKVIGHQLDSISVDILNKK